MRLNTKSGFTLTEILTVSAFLGVISTGAMGFYVQSMKSSSATEQRIELQNSMRSFTNELVFNGSRSHELVLYNSTDSADVTEAKRKVVVNVETETTSDDVCPTGDFAVFIYYELPKPADQSQYRIEKLIGYYLDDVDSGPPALVRMTIDLSGSPSTQSVEQIISSKWSTAARKTIAPRVNPLAKSDDFGSDSTPQLFYKRANQNIAVCGQLLQSTTKKDTKDLNTHTRTFYFNVTVRS